jgi:hypothetical protein
MQIINYTTLEIQQYNTTTSTWDVIATLGGGGGSVDSVNGLTGIVVLDADDIPETASRIYFSTAEETKLAGIEALADVTDAANVNPVVSNSTVIDKVLTGFSAAAGTVAATDTILQAFNKVQGNSTNTKLTKRTSCTVTGTFNTNCTYTGFYTRIGAIMFLEVYIAFTGAPNSTNLLINIPSVEGAVNTPESARKPVYGFGMIFDASTSSQYYLLPEYQNSTQMYIGVGNTAGTYLSFNGVTQAVPITLANNDLLSIYMLLPITEWI